MRCRISGLPAGAEALHSDRTGWLGSVVSPSAVLLDRTHRQSVLGGFSFHPSDGDLSPGDPGRNKPLPFRFCKRQKGYL